MRLRLPLVMRDQKPYHYFMHTPDVRVHVFAERGKKTCVDGIWWCNCNVLGIVHWSRTLSYEEHEDVAVLESFTILLYDRTSNLTGIDEAQLELFPNKGWKMETIPPNKATLVQHIKRAVYQEGHCWGNATKAAPEVPSPENWGWTEPSNSQCGPLFLRPLCHPRSCCNVDAKRLQRKMCLQETALRCTALC